VKARTRPRRIDGALTSGLARLPGRGRDLKVGYRLQLAWPAIVGEMMSRYLFPVDVSGDRLVIGVTSAVWMQEAEYQKDVLLANIARELGSTAIKGVTFRMLAQAPEVPELARALAKPAAPAPASPWVPKAAVSDAPAGPAAAPQAPALPPEKAAELEAELARIADPALREQMRRILTRSLARSS
jgi:hypothetical protein